MEFCRRSLESLEQLEELVYTVRHARELHNTFLWPLAAWPLEVLLAFYECDFVGALGSADAGMKKMLTKCFSGWGRQRASNSCSTKLAECPARILLAPSSKLAYVVEGFGRAPLAVQLEGEAETRGASPEEMFNSQRLDFSAGEKFFEGKPSNLAQPDARGHDWPFRWLRGLVVHCGRARQVAARGARHLANRS